MGKAGSGGSSSEKRQGISPSLSLWGINTETNEAKLSVENILYLYKQIWIAVI